MPIDRSKLYPVIVPVGYVPKGTSRMPLIEGLEVTLVIDVREPDEASKRPGMIRGVREVDLAADHVTPTEAYRIAIENLTAAAKKGLIHATGFPGPDGKIQFVLWADHWLAATCLLLPGLYEKMAATLGTENIIVMIPHRDVLVLFPDKDPEFRAATAKLVRDKEKDGTKRITERLLRLLPSTNKPFYEAPVVEYAE